MSSNQNSDIFDRYLSGNATIEEIRTVENWLEGLASDENQWNSLSKKEKDHFVGQLFKDVKNDLHKDRKVVSLKRSIRPLSLAAILILAVFGIWFFTRPSKTNTLQEQASSLQQKSIMPGSEKATLTLSNGQILTLDPSINGLLTTENGVSINNENGKLSYSGSLNTGKEIYNTVQTPKGGQYSLMLDDGTRVWLNAASSLRFPASFTGEERIVEVTGECYFDVTHTGKPFIVKTGDVKVEVLGTKFNINSYRDEGEITVSLINGSVKVIEKSHEVRLKPGEQAVVTVDAVNLNKQVDLETVLAWKNGYFSFHDADITTIMNQLSRWYDVELVYKGGPVDGKFSGEISRSLTLGEVLNILHETGINYSLQGRKLIVLP